MTLCLEDLNCVVHSEAKIAQDETVRYPLPHRRVKITGL
jgi:hypothetical protein